VEIEFFSKIPISKSCFSQKLYSFSISGREDEATMMWTSNYAGNGYGFQTYSKAPMKLSILGGIVGDDAAQNAMKNYTKAWSFKHPSPWDFLFFMNNELGQNLEWFWYYWLWTTESVEGSIQNVTVNRNQTIVTIHQAGEMPSPVILKVEFEEDGPTIKPMSNAKMIEKNVAIETWPVDVWFNGSRTFDARLEFGSRKIKQISFDPYRRFPDKNPDDNICIK
jgi:hypothetical protein